METVPTYGFPVAESGSSDFLNICKGILGIFYNTVEMRARGVKKKQNIFKNILQEPIR